MAVMITIAWLFFVFLMLSGCLSGFPFISFLFCSMQSIKVTECRFLECKLSVFFSLLLKVHKC